jgi:hypothetical protein
MSQAVSAVALYFERFLRSAHVVVTAIRMPRQRLDVIKAMRLDATLYAFSVFIVNMHRANVMHVFTDVELKLARNEPLEYCEAKDIVWKAEVQIIRAHVHDHIKLAAAAQELP